MSHLFTLFTIQGPRSNFEIGGWGGGGMTEYWGGGTKHFFLLTLYNFLKYWGGGHVSPCPPTSQSLQFVAVSVFSC